MKTHEPGCTAGSSWTFEKGVTYHPCSCGAPDIPLDYGTLIEELRRIDPSPDKSGWTTEAAEAIETLSRALESAVDRLNIAADIVSEWSGTKPDVYTVDEFVEEAKA